MRKWLIIDWSTALGKRFSLKSARKDIEDLIEQPGPYGHNIITLTLRMVANRYGYGEANRLVDELELDSHFGIPKYWPAIEMLKHGSGNIEDRWEGPTKKQYRR